ncbi:RIIA lysis inhibitor [Streptomyces phage Wakanda]|uniref:RIIA-like protein n=1 Tax=Streptomyces phage Wakanda TaxID=2713267 RepID=A0A6G8R1P3_9CAUD|nr:RIIA lysis inhibitor [Streptomyces phage Wakanda]QIN94104.1 hypothetical protein SEA_WAKANDA_137 [Streptomyces phage Wakanda]
MRPNTVVVNREGSLSGTEHKMMFDENSVAHLMSVLTDLYSDPELAVIREYSTNALDSQIAAGVSRPIEVTTPNPLSPFFKVKDYGLGMDEDDIENIYSKYGASTKRDSDSVVGMLGLGCKSALTYTQQFTLNTVKNGVKYMVAVSRTEDGSGVMEVIDSIPTDEPNGVEVVVPVKRHHEFEPKSFDFFKFWEPGTVLVNGKEPAHIEGNPVVDGVLLVKGLPKDYVVMGNVPYPLDDAHSLSGGSYGYYRRYGIVATVEIGAVNFTPSRESLHYTKRTEASLAELKRVIDKRMPVAIQEHIDAQDGELNAWKAYHSWKEIFGGYYGNSKYLPVDFSYKGETFDEVVSHEMMVFDLNAYRYAVQGTTKFSFHDLLERTIIFGYDKDKVAGAHREKMREYHRLNVKSSRNSNKILITEDKPEIPDWLPVTYVSWDDIKKIKVQRAPSTPRQEATFEVFKDGKTSYLTKSNISATKIVLVKPGHHIGAGGKKLVEKLTPGAAVVTLTQSRWESFKKNFPQAQGIQDYLNETLDAARDALTEDDRTYLSLGYSERNSLGTLDASRIDDPSLAQLITFLKTRTQSATVQRYADAQSIYYDVAGVTLTNRLGISDGKDALADYPLIDGINSQNMEDAYFYINAKYATMNK